MIDQTVVTVTVGMVFDGDGVESDGDNGDNSDNGGGGGGGGDEYLASYLPCLV